MPQGVVCKAEEALWEADPAKRYSGSCSGSARDPAKPGRRDHHHGALTHGELKTAATVSSRAGEQCG